MNTQKMYVIREFSVRPIEVSLDRLVIAPNEDAALMAWCAAVGEEEPYSVEAVPPYEHMTAGQRRELQLLERL